MDINKNKKYISLYDKDRVILEIEQVYVTNLLNFLYQVKLYSCPELEFQIIPHIDTVDFIFHFEKHIDGYSEPLKAIYMKSKQELEAYQKLFAKYVEADNHMTLQEAIDILEFFNTEDKTSEYDLTDDGTGKKYDSGKPMVGTLTDVFSRALMAVGACIEFGTHKYPNPKNWQLVDNGIKRYRDAMVRHLLKYNAGIDKDEETGLPHLAHMAWNALAILELYMQEYKDELDKEIFK